jgi:hypothetical protein
MKYVVTLELVGEGQPDLDGGTVVRMVVEAGLTSAAATDASVPSVTLAPGESVVAESLFERSEALGRSERLRVFRADD